MIITEYAMGTRLERSDREYALGYVAAQALCEDGVVRSIRFHNGGHADTFFSIPASVRVGSTWVSGFVHTSSLGGSDVITDDDPAVVRFRAYTYGKNYDLLPTVGRCSR